MISVIFGALAQGFDDAGDTAKSIGSELSSAGSVVERGAAGIAAALGALGVSGKAVGAIAGAVGLIGALASAKGEQLSSLGSATKGISDWSAAIEVVHL